jgi:opacity protein-like surface antigen
MLLLCSLRAVAQPAPRLEFRPFAVFAVERFTASTTFDANLGSSFQPLWGGGVEISTRRHVFVDFTVTRLSRTGEQAFVNNGQVFRLGIPLHATLTPVEFTAGYRFPAKRRRLLGSRRRPIVIPYAGVGIGVYRYEQTSDFAAAGENVDETHAGFVAVGGAEFRVSKWIGITADAQYTAVPGILGQTPSLSQQVGEHDLGGIAGRVRVILGR